MGQCTLYVLVTPGEPPIHCRRQVWPGDPKSGACYTCHPRGREQFIEGIVRGVLRRIDDGEKRRYLPINIPLLAVAQNARADPEQTPDSLKETFGLLPQKG